MKYRANPVIVDAFKITHIGEMEPDGSITLMLEDSSFVRASPGMLARMVVVLGDYWVIQSDGYIYLNPKDVFERKYSLIVP
jgi:hypothetical protein